mmetsp:Transcript_9768/g.17830  ORF Transcript_9768/g.17830 Transcript_9768/m.17830 type:complete len:103 (-) Transcript_9768:36-344(-)
MLLYVFRVYGLSYYVYDTIGSILANKIEGRREKETKIQREKEKKKKKSEQIEHIELAHGNRQLLVDFCNVCGDLLINVTTTIRTRRTHVHAMHVNQCQVIIL